jgi:hypothetical protein
VVVLKSQNRCEGQKDSSSENYEETPVSSPGEERQTHCSLFSLNPKVFWILEKKVKYKPS